MTFIPGLDPFVEQLIVLPFTAVGLGIAALLVFRKLIFGPIVTLFLTLLYEIMYHYTFYSGAATNYSSWNLILPAVTLLVSWHILITIKQEKVFSQNKTETN
ncbi:hypothetical protein [Alkalicoccus daliensis]|uniref:Uncharacterized protein n=1 Tax=Alkalicoccus daliensis TaxID=745820 RepID=A0A1H0CR43_9BACI|nr:hypothetical protein [Alkalicoccus daliensis]SDN60191.1 hypothetical protein SAMN04488053_102193 [Alkalicoccus daliensis]